MAALIQDPHTRIEDAAASSVDPTEQPFVRLSRVLGWGVILYLLVFALRFAHERLYSDSSYYLLRAINERWFHIEHGRWVLALAELLPLAGTALGLKMHALIALYSINNVALLALSFCVVTYMLKDAYAGLALASVHVVGLTHGLFCPVFELYYGVDLLIVFWAVQRSRVSGGWPWIVAMALLFFGAISSHFLALLLAIMLLPVIGFRWNGRLLLVLLAVLIGHLVLHMLTLSIYERSALEFLDKLRELSVVAGLFTPHVLLEMFRYVLRHYPDVLALTLITSAGIFRRHGPLRALLFIGGGLVLYVLIGLFLPGIEHDRYREQVNFAAVAWVLIVFCIVLLPHARHRLVLLAILLLIVVFRVERAERISSMYAARTAWHTERIAAARAQGIHKGIVGAGAQFGTPEDHVDLSWSTSVESMLLSAQDGPEHCVSLITTDDVRYSDVAQHLDRYVHRRWEIADPAYLNAAYFHLPAGRYVPMDSAASALMDRIERR